VILLQSVCRYTPPPNQTENWAKPAMRYLLTSLLVVTFSASAQTDKQRADIAERIKSFSTVCVTGEVCNAAGGDAMAAPAMDAMAAAALPGEGKYVTCAACHGANGGGGIGPALAGQSTDYIAGRLTAYRANEMVGAQSALMWPNAMNLSDEDIQDLAEYVASF